MQAHEVMTKSPTTVRSTDTIALALQRLAALDVRHLPVVDAEDALIGMLSERDLLGAFGPEGTPHDVVDRSFHRSVADIMSTYVFAVDPDTAVTDIIDVITAHRIGAVPVIDEHRVVVGIVSYVDLLRALRSWVPAAR